MGNVVEDIAANFHKMVEYATADGWQLEDIAYIAEKTLLYSARRLVREALEAVPCGDGTDKALWVAEQLKSFYACLLDRARFIAQAAFGVWVGWALDVVRKRALEFGEGWIDEWVNQVIHQIVEWAYWEEATDPTSPVVSQRLEKAKLAVA